MSTDFHGPPNFDLSCETCSLPQTFLISVEFSGILQITNDKLRDLLKAVLLFDLRQFYVKSSRLISSALGQITQIT